MSILRCTLALLAILLAAPALGADDADLDWLRGSLQIGDEQNPDREIPFLLGLSPKKGATTGVILNGAERVEMPVTRTGANVLIDFPHYDSRIQATIDYHGMLIGIWSKTVRGGKERILGFRASPISRLDQEFLFGSPFHPDDPERANFGGIWAMRFQEDGVAKGVFEQNHEGALTGTIQTPTGDYRFLSGNVDGDTMRLSVFDGSHAFLFEGEMKNDVMIEGVFYSGNHWKDPFIASRAEQDFELPDPFKETWITSDDGKLHIDALQRAPYKGKPTIVVVFGTWCPNCNDEAKLLKELYEEHHANGLQILGLAYEHTDNDARNRRQVQRFKERFDIPWEIIVTGTSDKSEVSKQLPDISKIKSYPTTIFIGADGVVEAVHSGFSGPATGDAYEHLCDEFERLVRRILETSND